MNMDNFLWTDFHTSSTCHTFLFVYLCHTIFIYKNGSKFAFVYAGSTAGTAICTGIFALKRSASSITGNQRSPVWKLFLFCHINASFHKVCQKEAGCISVFRRNGNKHLQWPAQ